MSSAATSRKATSEATLSRSAAPWWVLRASASSSAASWWALRASSAAPSPPGERGRRDRPERAPWRAPARAGAGSSAHGSIARRFMVELGPGASTALGFADGVSPGFSSSLLGELGPGASTALGFADGVSPGVSSSLLGELGPGASTAFGFAGRRQRPASRARCLASAGRARRPRSVSKDGVRLGFSSSLLGDLGPGASTAFGFAAASGSASPARCLASPGHLASSRRSSASPFPRALVAAARAKRPCCSDQIWVAL